MSARAPERIRVESDAGVLERFNVVELSNELTAPSQCAFDVGDDGSYPALEAILRHGKTFRVYLADRLRLTGRVYAQEVPGNAEAGTTVRVTVRTKLADAFYASADPRTRVEKTSIKDFLVALYAPLGLGAADFVFKANVERDLMTGVGTKAERPPASLEPLKVDQAKVTPPETIYEAAAKHLRRFGLLHWDTPDGRIFVGAPDDQQLPIYRLVCKRGSAAVNNNLVDFQRFADWTDVPSSVDVYGGPGGKDIAKARLMGSAEWPDVKAEFHRPVILTNEGAKTQGQVDAQARRARAQRSKRKDAYEITLDTWSFWDGHKAIPFAPNTTADVDIDAVGGPRGRYFVHRVACREDAHSGRTTALSLVAPGVWEV